MLIGKKISCCKKQKQQVREINRFKLLHAKWMSHGFEMYRVGNITNNYVIYLYGDRWYLTYSGDHFEIHLKYKEIFESLWHVMELIVISQLYFRKKLTFKKKKKKLTEKEVKTVVTTGKAVRRGKTGWRWSKVTSLLTMR